MSFGDQLVEPDFKLYHYRLLEEALALADEIEMGTPGI
jgi:hypothetical protein